MRSLEVHFSVTLLSSCQECTVPQKHVNEDYYPIGGGSMTLLTSMSQEASRPMTKNNNDATLYYFMCDVKSVIEKSSKLSSMIASSYRYSSIRGTKKWYARMSHPTKIQLGIKWQILQKRTLDRIASHRSSVLCQLTARSYFKMSPTMMIQTKFDQDKR